MKKIIGIIMLLVGLLGVIIGIAGCMFVGNALDGIGTQAEASLTQVVTGLDATTASLEEVKTGIGQASTALNDVDASISTLLGANAPAINSMKEVQAMMPTVIGYAEQAEGMVGLLGTINPLLESQGMTPEMVEGMLSGMGVDLSLDFLDFVPEVKVVDSISGISDQIDAQIVDLSAQQGTYSSSIQDINGTVSNLSPQIDAYLGVVAGIKDQISGINANLGATLGSLKTAVTVLMVWLILGNLAPLYLGWEIVSGKR